MNRLPPKDPATQQVDLCQRLREAIILGHLQGGQRLTEKFVSEEMGVKRGPARESLLILEGQGLIRKVPSLGYFVESYSEEDIHDACEVRLTIETQAIRRAAARIERENLIRLELLCQEEQVANQRDDRASRVRIDLEFHREIVRASGSGILEQSYATLARPIYTILSDCRLKGEIVAQQHRNILDALRARNETLAVELLIEHIKSCQDTP